jgi:hypothetical protein
MPIRRFSKDRALESDEAEILNQAFSLTLRALHLVDRGDDPLAELVAKKIIEIGATGVRDPQEISTQAVKQLGVS